MTQRDDTLQRVVNAVDRMILWVAGVALVLMMIHISADVVATLVLGAPLALTNTIVTHYYMIAIAYLPLAAGELRSSHISVDLVVNRMPVGLQSVVNVLMQTLTMAVYFVLAVQAWQVAMEKLGRDAFLMEQTTRVSIWLSFFIIPVGFGLIGILIAVRLACRLLGRPEPSTPAIAEDVTHV
jgi:TRAP-type C4-dicarboxylate transport system permease small subunit